MTDVPIELIVDELVIHGTVRHGHADLLEAIEQNLRSKLSESAPPRRQAHAATSRMADTGFLAETIQSALTTPSNAGRGFDGQNDEELGRRHRTGRPTNPRGAGGTATGGETRGT